MVTLEVSRTEQLTFKVEPRGEGGEGKPGWSVKLERFHGEGSVALEVRGDEVRVIAGPTDTVTQLTVFGAGGSGKLGDLQLDAEPRSSAARVYASTN